MEWNLSSGAATVIITGMALVWGAILKIFPKKEKAEVVESFMKSIKEIVVSMHLLQGEQNKVQSLMSQKINGSHEKLDLVHKLVINMPKTEGRIDEIWKSTVKD